MKPHLPLLSLFGICTVVAGTFRARHVAIAIALAQNVAERGDITLALVRSS